MPQDASFGSPEFFPYSLDVYANTVSFIRLTPADYVRASFLDSRILSAGMSTRVIAWSDVEQAIAATRLEERCSFIFHLGHVGSTLLARLLGAHPNGFALREPLILRTLAEIDAQRFHAHVGGAVKLLSRTFEAGQQPVVKATSFVSEIAAALLARAAAPRALLLFVTPEAYLATILGGPNSRREAQQLTPGRLRRLHRRIGGEVWRLGSLSEGEALAMGWACEMSALTAAAAAGTDRVRRLDFDRFLSQPQAELTAVLRHFHLDASAAVVDAILQGPDMGRYSKAPQHAYDAALRRDVLHQARAEHRSEILRGLHWLEQAALRTPMIGAALTLASRLP